MTLSRRRFLTISAAAAGVGMSSKAYSWRGVALGADVSITLHSNTQDAQQIIPMAVARIRHLENQFSIYQKQSVISQLNETGQSNITHDFNALINEVNDVHAHTGGLFDPTIQPLWRAYADDPDLPIDEHKHLLLRVGWQHVETGQNTIRFARSGMALTLNGIAQGFITDQVSTLLRSYGYFDATVNIGEYRAGEYPARIGVGDTADTVTLQNAALATSTPTALMLNTKTGHIIHPKLAATPGLWNSITVQAKRASIADGVSTALCLAPDMALAHRLIKTGVIQRCVLVDRSGKITTLAG